MGRSEARARSNSIRYRGMNQITKPKPGDVPAKGTTRGTAYQPPYATAGIVTLAVFALYAITLSRTTWFWDTSEYIEIGRASCRERVEDAVVVVRVRKQERQAR